MLHLSISGQHIAPTHLSEQPCQIHNVIKIAQSTLASVHAWVVMHLSLMPPAQGEAPLYSHQLQSSIEVLEANLARSKSRIAHLLHVLQNVSQVQKLSKLESLYGAPQAGRGPKIQPPHKQEWDTTRKRTRSTGAIRTKHVSTEKHSKAMTLNL